ncbi:MAG: M23 family metallopeptidase [Solibacillus sp.]
MSSNTNNKDLNTPKTSIVRRHNGKLKVAALAAFLISSVSFNLGFAKETEQTNSFKKIYHIYVANSYIGTVSDYAVVEQIIQNKEQEANEKYKEFTVDAASMVKVVPEQVFEVESDDTDTAKKLEEAIVVKAAAYALVVNGEPVAYLKDQADFEQVVKELKLQYVSQKELDELASRQPNETLPTLKKNETRILEISLSADITGNEKKVFPSSIMTVDEALRVLKTGSLEEQVYKVKPGDVLGSIAKAHNLKLADLLKLNPNLTEKSILNIGQELNITIAKPFVTVKVVREKVNRDTIDFAKIVEEDETMLKGEKVVKQEGTVGKMDITYVITEENGIRTDRVQTAEKVLREPESRIVIVGTKVIPSQGTGQFAWPAVGGYISSHMGHRWGRQHEGIDIARPSNYTIKAADNGVVVKAERHSTLGNYVMIDHNNGYKTVYGHMSKISVSVGETVAQGASLGVMGSTGRSTGTHLHFEVHKEGTPVNPMAYLNK